MRFSSLKSGEGVVMIKGVSKAVQEPSPESGVHAARASSAKYAGGPERPGWFITALLSVILCVGCTVEMPPIATVTPSFTPPAKTATAAPVTQEVLELAKQYKELRKVKGYFTGGEWNDDVDSSRGRLYTILDELRQALGNPSYKRADIVLLMGEPDAILAHDSKEYLWQRGTPDLAGQGGAEKNLLVYFWRGWHDYVYFVCQDDTIQEAGWYFALE
jgi:hypothetical protein